MSADAERLRSGFRESQSAFLARYRAGASSANRSPLFLNRFQGRRNDQSGAGASARRQQLPPASRNAPGEKLASSLLHVGLARDRERCEVAERVDLLRMQPRLIKQLAVVRNGLVCVQEKGSQPSVTKLADIVGICKRPRFVLFEQPSKSATANSDVVVPPDRAERRILKRDRKKRIEAPVDRLRRVSASSIATPSPHRWYASAPTRYEPLAQRL